MNQVLESSQEVVAARPIVSPARLAHVVLRTSQFDALVHWYRTVLGATIAFSNGALAFMTSTSMYLDQEDRSSPVPGQSEISTITSPADNSSRILLAPINGPGQAVPFMSSVTCGCSSGALTIIFGERIKRRWTKCNRVYTR